MAVNIEGNWLILLRKIISRENLELQIHRFIFSENEANKRKLQQIQIRLEQTQAKEHETLTRFQASLAVVEQNQFDRADVDH